VDALEDVKQRGIGLMKERLTKKQEIILEIITDYIDKNRIAPTNRELMELSGLKSTSTLHGYLQRLRDKGYITWRETMPRTLQVLSKG
jgi:repressor LexA